MTCRPRIIARRTPDPTLIEQFYGALFHWTPAGCDAPEPAGRRAIGPGCATAILVEGASACPWRTFFATPDPGAVARRAAAAGGTVAPSELIGGAQEVADRSGDVFGLVEGDGRDDPRPRETALGTAELAAHDVPAAGAFLAEVLAAGLHPVGGDPFELALLLEDGELVTSVFKRLMLDLPTWVPYIRVPDVRVMTARATELGARTVLPPLETPTGAQALITDPDGVVLGLMEFPHDADGLRRLVDPDPLPTVG